MMMQFHDLSGRSPPNTASSEDVCNQTLLAFDRSILASLFTSDTSKLALIQLRFAQVISEQAARASAETIELLEVEATG